MGDSKTEWNEEAQLAEDRERAREFFGADWVDDEEEKKQELTAHEELTRSFEALSKLVVSIDNANIEWMADLLDELNDPTKENLISRITGADEASELIATLNLMKQDEQVPLSIEQEFFDPVRFQTDLLNVATVVDKAKQKGSKRMDKLFASFQNYKQTQKDIVNKAISKFINDNNLPKMESRISELEDMISRMKIGLMEKKYVYSMQKADHDMSIEELRHKYEADIEEHIRHLIAKIEQNKTEIIRLDNKYEKALEATEAVKNDLSIVLHDIDKEEKTSTLKDMSLVQFINQDGVSTTEERPETDIITQEDVDKSFKTLEQAMAEYAQVLVKIAEAEEKTKVRRAELAAVLKSEENKALERLKNMVHEMERKIEADRKRIPVLEVIVKHIDKEGHASYLKQTAERRATIQQQQRKSIGHSSHHFGGADGVSGLGSLGGTGGGVHRHTVAAITQPLKPVEEERHGRSQSSTRDGSPTRNSASPESRSPSSSHRSPSHHNREKRPLESNNAALDALLNGVAEEETQTSRQNRATFVKYKANIVPEHDRPHPPHDHVGYTSGVRTVSSSTASHQYSRGEEGGHQRHSPVFNVQRQFDEREEEERLKYEETEGVGGNRREGRSDGIEFDDSRATTARGTSRGGGQTLSRPNTGHFSFEDSAATPSQNSLLAAYQQGMRAALGVGVGGGVGGAEGDMMMETPTIKYGTNLESPGSFRNKVMVSDSYAPPPSAKEDDSYYPQMDSGGEDNNSTTGSPHHHDNHNHQKNLQQFNDRVSFPQMQHQGGHKHRQTFDGSSNSSSGKGSTGLVSFNNGGSPAGGPSRKQRNTTIGKSSGMGGGGGASAHNYQVARSVSNYQVKKVQNVIDMFHQERSRLADPHESQQILTYTTPQVVKNVDSAAVAEEVAEQMISQPLSRATLLIHNVNHTSLAKKISSSREAADKIKQNIRKYADRKGSKRKSIRAKSILNQSSGPNTAESTEEAKNAGVGGDSIPKEVGGAGGRGRDGDLDHDDSSSGSSGEESDAGAAAAAEGEGPARESEDEAGGVILVGVKKPANERKVAKIRQALKRSRPSREPFDSENYFKSATATATTGKNAEGGETADGASNQQQQQLIVEGKHSSKGSRLSTMSTAGNNRKASSKFSYFDANRLVLDGQEDEAAEFYRQTYGYTLALEWLNTLTNLLTNYNSNNINEMDGQVAFSKTAEEELGNVESLRHQINSHVNKIKQVYQQSNNINKILKAIQSDVNVHTRMMDSAKSDLLAAIEGVRWAKFLQPGEYQQEIDVRKARIRELKAKAKAWESKIIKQKRMNMRLSVLITDDTHNNRALMAAAAAGQHRGAVALTAPTTGINSTPLGAIKEVVVRQNNPHSGDEPKIHIKTTTGGDSPTYHPPIVRNSLLQPRPPQTQKQPSVASGSGSSVRTHSFRAVPQETPATVAPHGGKLSKSLDAQVPSTFSYFAPDSRESGDGFSVANNRLAIFNDITDIYSQTLEHLKSKAATASENDGQRELNDSPVQKEIMPLAIDFIDSDVKAGDIYTDSGLSSVL